MTSERDAGRYARRFVGLFFHNIGSLLTLTHTSGVRQAGALEEVAALIEDSAFDTDNGLLEDTSTSNASTKLLRARHLLPGCLSSGELDFLADKGLVVCSSSPCDSTCGAWLAYFFFPLFIVFSVVVLLNLVIASLLKSYSALLGRKPLSREIIHYKPGRNASLTKQTFKFVTLKWFHQAKARSEVMKMLIDAREAALRDRDALMHAITSQDNDALAALLRKLLPSHAGPDEAAGDADEDSKAASACRTHDTLIQDLRVLGNKFRGKELSQDAALSEMLEAVFRWRDILVDRAHEAASAEKTERVRRGYFSEGFQGYVKKRGQNNTAFKRRFFVLKDEWLRYYETQDAFESKQADKGQLSCVGMYTRKDKGMPCHFDIIDNAGRVLQCQCDEPSERDAWIENIAAAALAAAVAKSLQMQKDGLSPHHQEPAQETRLQTALRRSSDEEDDAERREALQMPVQDEGELEAKAHLEPGSAEGERRPGMPVGGQREGSVNSDHLDGEEEGAPHSTTDGSLEEEDREGEQGGAHEDLEDGYSVEYSRVTVLLAVDTEECTVIKGGGRGVATAQDGGGYVIDCGMFCAQIARAVKCGSARVLVAGVSAA